MFSLRLFIGSFALLLFICFTNAQSVPIDPIFDCSNPNFQVIYTACQPHKFTECCAVGTDCCAGGCCDLLSFCVGQGTSAETCCSFNDPTLCGTGPSLPRPSVVCDGSNGLSSYYCPPGSKCNIHDDTCYLPSASASQSPKATTSSTPTPQTDPAQSTGPAQRTTTEVPTSVTEQTSTREPTIPATVTVVSTIANTQGAATTAITSPATVSVVTVSSSPTATPTTKNAASNIVASTSALFLTGAVLVMIWL